MEKGKLSRYHPFCDTKAVFYNEGISPYPWCSEEKNTTDSKKAHFITLKNGVRGVLIENTTEIQKFRGVSKFRGV